MCVHMVHFYHYRAVLYPPFGKWTIPPYGVKGCEILRLYPPFGKWTIPPQWLLRKGTQFK